MLCYQRKNYVSNTEERRQQTWDSVLEYILFSVFILSVFLTIIVFLLCTFLLSHLISYCQLFSFVEVFVVCYCLSRAMHILEQIWELHHLSQQVLFHAFPACLVRNQVRRSRYFVLPALSCLSIRQLSLMCRSRLAVTWQTDIGAQRNT